MIQLQALAKLSGQTKRFFDVMMAPDATDDLKHLQDQILEVAHLAGQLAERHPCYGPDLHHLAHLFIATSDCTLPPLLHAEQRKELARVFP
jgi:hypothetical protein